ncbi:hypothetical protein SUGI_0712750 [Cryptomeria japonica]|nr:hypothetical protein SUGI_0712750 [Cryptomeria japonica]
MQRVDNFFSGGRYPASSIPHQSSSSLSNPHATVSSPTPFPFPPPPPSLSGDQTPSARGSCSYPSFFDSSATILSLEGSAEASAHLFRDRLASIGQARGDLGRSLTPPADQANVIIEIEDETVVHHVHSPQWSINSAKTVVVWCSILPLHSCPLHHFVEFPEDVADIIVEIGDSATPLGTSTAMAQPTKLQRLLGNGSPRSTPGTLSSSSVVQSYVFCFNCFVISCVCGCVACKLFQPPALPSLSHRPVEACEVNPSCPCVQPYPALPMEKVDTSPVAHQPPPNSFSPFPLLRTPPVPWSRVQMSFRHPCPPP